MTLNLFIPKVRTENKGRATKINISKIKVDTLFLHKYIKRPIQKTVLA